MFYFLSEGFHYDPSVSESGIYQTADAPKSAVRLNSPHPLSSVFPLHVWRRVVLLHAVSHTGNMLDSAVAVIWAWAISAGSALK